MELVNTNIFFIICLSIFISVILTYLVKILALKLEIVDKPDFNRKIHKKPIPLMGGLAVFLSFFILLLIFKKYLLLGDLNYHHWLGFFIGALFLLIGGLLDDRYNLSPKWQIIWPILSAISVVIGGVSIEKISSPLGGFIFFPFWLSSFIIFLWILGMTYTTKLLDGLDGLASGVSAIGALIIFLFTISSKYYQPDIAIASLIFFCVLLGFLIFNFNPAKIFLGESGSLLLGYILAVLAIISGGKIAIALLVIGLPALDVLWTIIRRFISGKNPFKHSDRKHLHHRLIDIGFSQKRAVLFFYMISGFFGFSGLFLQSRGKLWALLFLFFLMILIILFFYFLDKKKLLLHVCCAPCADYLIFKKLIKKYKITLYFCNSNIDSLEEYHKRLNEVKKMATEYNLGLEVEDYNHGPWIESIKGLESEREGSWRCFICYKDRLEKTVNLAKKLGINNFYTSLLCSPYKNSNKIKEISIDLAKLNNLNFINLDFDVFEFSKKSIKFAKNKNYYCQNYCACEFSKNLKN